jgi:hypothetical protein
LSQALFDLSSIVQQAEGSEQYFMNVVIPRTGITVQLGIMAELVNNPAGSELMVTNNESYQIDN